MASVIMEKYIRLRNPRFQALLHGDTHIGNTYFTPWGAPRFQDWQLIYIGSAFHDVAYFMAGTLTIQDRRANERRILDHYLDSLASFGGPKLESTDEEVWLDYRKSLLSGVAGL
ncbi:hypothetical protein GQ53DRAFT_831548 [Thozetella sp. PMI_491]|nr:hypothetical protein GQ53DRAFT_831548 [Thozetella sp. PMI_491]